MAEHDFHANDCRTADGFREAVCIDAMRVYDSCCDKDCLEDLRVYFTGEKQALIDDAVNVRVKDVDVITVYLDLEPVPFNKGFYSVDMTFFFDVCVDVFCAPATGPIPVNGISIFNKKVILYGSEGNVKLFSTDCDLDDLDAHNQSRVLPKASVQVAQPIALSACLCECHPHDACCRIPECICKHYGGQFETRRTKKGVYVTIGLFTIVQIARNVQMLIPTYDFCIPGKECVTTSDNPCELFRRIEFPTDEFFPPKVTENHCGCGSEGFNREGGCGHDNCNRT